MVEKMVVTVPDTVAGITKCFNPKCITNNEPIKTKFSVVSKKPVSLKCHLLRKNNERRTLCNHLRQLTVSSYQLTVNNNFKLSCRNS